MSIVTRTVLLTAAIAAIAVFVAGLVSYPLLNSAAESQTRGELVGLADLTATALDRDPGDGREGEPLPRPADRGAAGPADHRLHRGRTAARCRRPSSAEMVSAGARRARVVSAEGVTPSGQVLIEGRPLVGGGALFLRAALHGGARRGVRRPAPDRGGPAAGPAHRGAHRRSGPRAGSPGPCRAARDAANEMAAGSRSVTLRPEGPVEIADIAVSLNRLNAALVVSEGRQREFLLSVSARAAHSADRRQGLRGGAVRQRDPAGGRRTNRRDRAPPRPHDWTGWSATCSTWRASARSTSTSPRSTLDLVEIGEDAGAVWVDRATPRGGLASCWSCPTGPVIVRTDPIRVRQIIDNLAENALRVSPAGLGDRARDPPEGPWGVVEVRDSGTRTHARRRGVAFEPGVLHERYRGVRPVGTGLGLALVGKLRSRPERAPPRRAAPKRAGRDSPCDCPC